MFLYFFLLGLLSDGYKKAKQARRGDSRKLEAATAGSRAC